MCRYLSRGSTTLCWIFCSVCFVLECIASRHNVIDVCTPPIVKLSMFFTYIYIYTLYTHTLIHTWIPWKTKQQSHESFSPTYTHIHTHASRARSQYDEKSSDLLTKSQVGTWNVAQIISDLLTKRQFGALNVAQITSDLLTIKKISRPWKSV